jgi:hypothetical protein
MYTGHLPPHVAHLPRLRSLRASSSISNCSVGIDFSSFIKCLQKLFSKILLLPENTIFYSSYEREGLSAPFPPPAPPRGYLPPFLSCRPPIGSSSFPLVPGSRRPPVPTCQAGPPSVRAGLLPFLFFSSLRSSLLCSPWVGVDDMGGGSFAYFVPFLFGCQHWGTSWRQPLRRTRVRLCY